MSIGNLTLLVGRLDAQEAATPAVGGSERARAGFK
jgi:hypothetical protein